METQNLETKLTSTEIPIREQLRQEIAQAPEEILAITLDFLIFLKSRYPQPTKTKQPPSNASSLLEVLENMDGWAGDDFEECLEKVKG
ncbi:MAG: hypothetical protein WA865_07735 [Spirulinaceae cyanobacterium]